ncbi:carboxypeptidase regulatory-like domain-containing protein [Telmatobacter bradus]|uniref:TonB-dependent receptor n=1 Tax=Telmatobacter bradus TaxID=474953 RepID=UPI003B432DEC
MTIGKTFAQKTNRRKRGAMNALVLCLVIALLGFSIPRAHAQADTGRIAGIVLDPTGALIAHAAVTVLRVDTNTETNGFTDAHGEYVFPVLPVGNYSVTAKADGFIGETKQGLALDDGAALTVNFKLTLGSQSEQIIVSADTRDAVNTQSGTIEHIIDGDTVRDMALNGRNYLDLLGTLPGSVANANWATTSQPPDAMSSTMSGSTTNIVLNGVRATANGLYVDGVINKDIGSNAAQFNNIGIDFIEHMSAQTSSYSAQWGSSAGPAINVVTRSGTNMVHGTLFENLRNNLVDADQYFSNGLTSHLRFNDTGMALGFPIKKDKIFAFVGNEWKFIETTSAPSQQIVPLTSFLSGDFNYTTTAGKAACAITGNSYLLSRGITIPSTCNISTQITNFGHGMQNLYKYIESQATEIALDTNNNAMNFGYFALPQSYRNEEYIARVDWQISTRQNAYVRWVTDAQRHYSALGGNALLPSNPVIQHTPANNTVLSHTYTLTPNTFNVISVAAMWTPVDQMPADDTWEKSKYGFTYEPLFAGSYPKVGIPYMSWLSYTAIYDTHSLTKAHTTVLELDDILTTIKGKHTIKVGVVGDRNRKDQSGSGIYFNGNISFTTESNNYTTGNVIADALLGNFATYSENSNNTEGLFRLWGLAAYADDTYRVLPRVTLSLGVRGEWMTPWTSQQNNLTAFYPQYYDSDDAVSVGQDSGNVVAGSGNRYNGLRRAGNGVPNSQLGRVLNAQSTDVLNVPTIGMRGFYHAQYLWAPRVGFAWDLRGDGTLALRGGGGIFYDTPQGTVAYSTLSNPPYIQAAQLNYGNMDTLATSSNVTATSVIPQIYTVDPGLRRSIIYQYNLGIQQQLAKGFFMQITYVGNQGRHLLRDPDINAPDPAEELAMYAIDSSVKENYLRPYKGYSGILQYRSDADSNYNGLQTNLNRRVGKGRMTFAYTWSKNLATAAGDTDVFHFYPWVKNYSYTYTGYDRRQLYTGTYMVQSPDMRGHNRILRGGIGSWMLTGTARYQGGARYTPTASDTDGLSGFRPTYAGYPVVYPHNTNQWWDFENPGQVINFSAPTAGTDGNCPKGIIVGPTFFDADVSLRKTFNTLRGYHVTINLDSFNITNHPALAGPGVNISTSSYATTLNSSGTVDSKGLGIQYAGRSRNMQGGVKIIF